MKDNLNCGAFLDELSDYVDGVAGEALCAEIEQHMAGCDDCRIVVDTLKKTIYLYHETSSVRTVIPTDVRKRLFHRLNLDDFIS